MAKIVNPPAELESRRDDVELPLHLLVRLAPFSQLKQVPLSLLEKLPGAYKLRFFRAGEPVCVHGEPGWSAFCFVPPSEIAALSEYASKALQEGPANREKAAAALAKAQADQKTLEDEIAQPGLVEKDKKELEKKLDSLGRELDKLQASLAVIDEELSRLPDARRRFDTWLGSLHDGTNAAAQTQTQQELAYLSDKARRGADAGLRALLDELPAAPSARKRQIADLFEPAEPELARCVQALVTASDGLSRVAVTRLPRLRTQPPPTRGLFSRLLGGLTGKRSSGDGKPTFIPGDGPRDLDYRSRLCSIYDGELVGEISCLNRTPRSATITMTRDGFVVEVMRNILDLMRKDAAYLARVESGQRQRLINSALRETPLFAGLSEAELLNIAREMEFKEYEPGSLICDEHEEADCLYVIGNGIIKVVTGVSWLLPPEGQLALAELQKELGDKAANIATLQELPQVIANAAAQDQQAAVRRIIQLLNRMIADESWHDQPPLRDLAARDKLVPAIWRMISSGEHATQTGMIRCNRLVLNALDSKTYPALKADGAADGTFSVADFGADWKKLCTQIVADDKKPDDPARTVWDRLPSSIQDFFRKGRTEDPAQAARETMVAALNLLVRSELFLLTPAGSAAAQSNSNLATALLPMLAEGQLWGDFDFHRWNRCLNRLILDKLFPSVSKLPRPSGLPTILAYRSRSEIIGEIALVEGKPRSATLVTYNHPKNDPKREVGPVHLFRIGKAAIDKLLGEHKEIRKRLEALVAERRAADIQRGQGSGVRGQGVERSLLHSPQGEKLGLVEGQKLMLIDLDRCTRCDECVKACVNTHDDGHSRLFLVGHRHAHYLVPATCRSCLDPVCMIGCPVNSIQRGESKEILIRDWCIGCAKCAEQCPYGSIQMYDTGLIPSSLHGWHFFPAPNDEAWTKAVFDDSAWPADATPFVDDLTFDAALSRLPGYSPRGPVAFRHTFQLAKDRCEPDAALHLELSVPNEQARVWLNGAELHTEEKMRQGKRKYELKPARDFAKLGENVLAVWTSRPGTPGGQMLFTLRLDSEREADSAAVEIKLVTARAVVCDLCGTLPTGPACVTACPHEAAMRVDAVRA